MLKSLGASSASTLLGSLFRLIGPSLPVTKVAHRNLQRAFPHQDAAWRRQVVRDMWEGLGRTAGEFPHLADLRPDTPQGPGWELVGGHVLEALARQGGPVIFVSGHIGNWEMLPAAAARRGLPFAGVYRAGSNRAVDEVVLGWRRRAIGQDVPMFPKGAAGARAALAHLRGGGRLAMLVDQKMNDGIAARLFGLPAMTAPAAAALALRFGCPVVPGHVERLGPARLRVIVDEPLALPDSGDRQADVLQLTQSINDRLERWIRQAPHGWLWLHRRFAEDAT